MTSSKFDIEMLKQISCNRLIRILEEAPGSKDLVIDKDLMKMLDRIADAKILRTHGVSKMFHFERIPPAVSTSQLVYLIKPSLINMKYVIDQFHELKNVLNLQVHVICCPRIVHSINILLEEEGLFGCINLHEFTPEFIPLDKDLLSLEMNSFFKDAFIDGDFSGCLPVARSLHTLQSLYGPMDNIFGHGRAAQVVLKMLKHVEQDTSSTTNSKNNQAKVNIQEQLPNYFGTSVNIVTTQCVILEVEALSKIVKNLYGAWLVVKQFPVHQCGHRQDRKPAIECIKSLIKENNPQKYILATMDNDLRNYINTKVIGTPVLYLHDKSPTIEKPSTLSEEHLNDKDKVGLTQEIETLKTLKRKIMGEEAVLRPKKKRKGANPLSCLKKKKKSASNSTAPKKPRRRRNKQKDEDIHKCIKNVFSNS